MRKNTSIKKCGVSNACLFIVCINSTCTVRRLATLSSIRAGNKTIGANSLEVRARPVNVACRLTARLQWWLVYPTGCNTNKPKLCKPGNYFATMGQS